MPSISSGSLSGIFSRATPILDPGEDGLYRSVATSL